MPDATQRTDRADGDTGAGVAAVQDAADRVADAARELGDHPVVEAGARAGYAVNGILHLLIAWLALPLAFGRRGAAADQSGAMAMLAGNPAGWVVLLAVVVSFVLLAVWQVTEAIGHGSPGARAKAAAKALTYLVLAWGAVSVLSGVRGSGDRQARDATAALMTWPFGPVLVALVGLGVAAVGVYHIQKGWTQRFRRDLASTPSPFTLHAGRFGYIAKGIALIAVGGTLVAAGVQQRASESKGLDGALHTLLGLPLGQAVVAVIAVGFAAFGVYSFSRARRART